MKRHSQDIRKLAGAATNVTPLLDLVFVLLAIFILTASRVQNDLPVSLPEASSDPASDAATENKKVHTLTVYPNALSVDGNPCSLPDLPGRIRSVQGNAVEPLAILLQAEAEIPYQKIVDVLDVLNNAGLKQVQLATTVHK